MHNEILFFSLLFFVLLTTLFAFRLGRAYLFGLVMLEAGLMNIFVVKQFDFFGLAVTGGNVLYGGIFLATDLLNEFYGKRIARKAVWAGFGGGVFMLITTQLVSALTPNAFDTSQNAFSILFSPTARIVFASLVSYLIFQSFDVWFYDFLKRATNGRFLWLRNNLATILSQTGDSFFFTFFGLLSFSFLEGNKYLTGFLPYEAFWNVVFFTIAMKIIVALLDTPIMYLAYRIKRESPSLRERIQKYLD